MKKWTKILIAVLSVLAAVGIFLFFFWNSPADKEEKYLEKVNKLSFFENNLESAVPQTDVYKMITEHFSSKLPKGKKVKKAIVIGYDGCRLDALEGVGKDKTKSKNLPGAMDYILSEGGKAYISYCGGANYPEKITQDTSTAPGWCSMLTGQWASVHGITGNDIIKSNDHLTLLTTLVEDKVISKSAFYVSWKGHFSRKKATYLDEVKYIEDNSLDVSFICNKNDDATKLMVKSDLINENCSDFIFTILEYCDHSGHQKGFYTGKKSYQNAFYNADSSALEIISEIKNRETYDEEDWLILLTTDHGGKGRDHGKASIQERYTFIFTLRSTDEKTKS